MHYWLVKRAGLVIGVQAETTWQDACLAQWNMIRSDWEIKSLGDWIGGEAWVRKRAEDRAGWWRVIIIPDGELTLEAGRAYDPGSVARIMTELGKRLVGGDLAAWEEARPYLFACPIDVQQAFARIHTTLTAGDNDEMSNL